MPPIARVASPALAVATLLLSAAPAAAEVPTIEAFPVCVTQEEDHVTFVGAGFVPGDTVQVGVDPAEPGGLGTADADDDGMVEITTAVGTDVAVGEHTVRAVVDGEEVASSEWQVTGPDAPCPDHHADAVEAVPAVIDAGAGGASGLVPLVGALALLAAVGTWALRTRPADG